MIETLILAATLFIAYANGANDNFKGVATLFGSGTTNYRKALLWATLTTFAGSIAAFFLARKLVTSFSGKGLIPDAILAEPSFMIAVILGAGLTVFIASKIGIPISTTHSLVGALVGAGCMAGCRGLVLGTLGKDFFAPLLLSPLMAIVLTMILYPLFRWARQVSGVTKTSCICVGEKVIPVASLVVSSGTSKKGTPLSSYLRFQECPLFGRPHTLTAEQLRSMDIFVDEQAACNAKAIEIYQGRLFGIPAQTILDFLHFLSAGAVSFARGLNDTPKIVALCVTAGILGFRWDIALVALAMAIGGILGARKVAETLSYRITAMNHGQGFTANLVTAFLVIFASKLGLPVSTTHVSCGALFGIGAVTSQARWKMIHGIFSAWVLTLPIAASFSGISFWVLGKWGLF